MLQASFLFLGGAGCFLGICLRHSIIKLYLCFKKNTLLRAAHPPGGVPNKCFLMDDKIKGYIYGIISAVSYAMNPLGALFLYEENIQPVSVLFYRFLLGTGMLGLIMLVQRRSFAVKLGELKVLALLGLIFAVSSLTFFESFRHLGGGVAATIVFMYPVMVALLMAVFFKERLTVATGGAILMTVGGILLLYKGDDGSTLSTVGIVLALLSALAYAVYIVVVNRSSLRMPSVKLTFYAMLFCLVCIVLWSFAGGEPLQQLTTPSQWFFASLLGLVPTVISLLFMTMAIHYIGSTPTAVMGALEPVTAVLIGFFIFGEALTARLMMGVVVILAAVILIVFSRHVNKLFNRLMNK